MSKDAPVQAAVVESALAATDFSEAANAAVAHAYAVVRPGGTVHLLHVVELREPRAMPNPLYAHYVRGRAPTAEERKQESCATEQMLAELIPAEALAKRIETRVHTVEARDVAGAILDAASRLRVSLVCVGSRQRSPLSRMLNVSVARTLLRRSPSSLLIVRVVSEPR